MIHTRREWKEMESWSSETTVARLKVLREEIEIIQAADIEARPDTNEDLGHLSDEVVFLLLLTLKAVIRERRWTGITAMDLFQGVYCEMSGWAWSATLSRFIDTKKLVEDYSSEDLTSKAAAKAKLISRGFI